MAKNILKEAIADAKAVREVALANAKAALEEAFTPKLQSMLSAKLSETLNEDEEIEENVEETETVSEISGMDEEETMDESENLDEEIDLEEILNELELEESEEVKEETVEEAKEEVDENINETEVNEDEIEESTQTGKPNYKADSVQKVTHSAEDVHAGLNEGEAFNLDALLEEINNLDETEDEVNEEVEETNESVTAALAMGAAGIIVGGTPLLAAKSMWDLASPEKRQELASKYPKLANLMTTLGIVGKDAGSSIRREGFNEGDEKAASEEELANMEKALSEMMGENTQQEEIAELKAALEVKSTELNEVNLLNSKLLYVNRIFKANTLDDAQKLRVVETLDKADCIKEAKLIYETIKDTFNVAKSKKASVKSKTKSLKENFGMASKAAGTSTAPKKEVIAESDNLVNRFQKLANIKINQ